MKLKDIRLSEKERKVIANEGLLDFEKEISVVIENLKEKIKKYEKHIENLQTIRASITGQGKKK